MSIQLHIEKNFGRFRLKTDLEGGDEVLALLGASGCGKSMTLRCIAGIERPDRGSIIVDDVTLFDSERHINLSPQKRRTGLMFQNYALFPNMTVRQNVRAGARRDRRSEGSSKSVERILDTFGLTELADRYPSQLSGGQQQRTALARILVSDPQILLLDEPFSALDSHLRFQLEQELRRVIRDFGKTVILVSHDRDEVFCLSDKVAVMNNGRVEMLGTREEVFFRPQTVNVARLTGCKNISKCSKISDSTVFAENWGVKLTLPEGTSPDGYLGIRMNEIIPGEGENSVICRVTECLESLLTVTVMLQPENAGASAEFAAFGMEIEKTLWENIKAETLSVRLPKEKLLVLKEENQ